MKHLSSTLSNMGDRMNKKNPWSLKKKLVWTFFGIIIFIAANFVYEFIVVAFKKPQFACFTTNKGIEECHGMGVSIPHAPLFKLVDYLSYIMIPEVSLPDLVWDESTEEMTKNQWFFTNNFPSPLGEQKIKYDGSVYYVVFKGSPNTFYSVWQGSFGIESNRNHYMKPGSVILDVPQTIKEKIESIFKNTPDEYVIITYNDTFEIPAWGIKK